MTRIDREAWGFRVQPQLSQVMRPRDIAVMYCGEEYLAPLRPHLEKCGVSVELPLGTLSLGARLQELYKRNDEELLRSTAVQFNHLMYKLWVYQNGGRIIRNSHGRLDWPSRGVYFVLESHREIRGGKMPRIVRVGTHAVSSGSKTSLWDRLSSHRGTAGGSGSHRSSIFRLHLGRAWMRHNPLADWPSTWAQGQSAPRSIRDPEQHLEREVSKIIGAMSVVWLDINDDPGPYSERAYIERNAIGLLSRMGLLNTSNSLAWLGRWSADWRIATSGLWNLNHVFARPDPMFIVRLKDAVARTVGNDINLELDSTLQTNNKQLNFFDEGTEYGSDS